MRAPSSAATSRLSITLRTAKRRTDRSLAVNAPSRNTGWKNKLVVAIEHTTTVSSRAARHHRKDLGLGGQRSTSRRQSGLPWSEHRRASVTPFDAGAVSAAGGG